MAVAEALTYTVEYDSQAVKRVQRATIRSYGGLTFAFALFLFGWLLNCAFLGSTLSKIVDPGAASHVWPAVISASVGLLGVVLGYSLRWQLTSAFGVKDAGEVWTCEIGEERWTFTRQDGYSTSVPWNLMKLRFEHPEGWWVQCGRVPIVVMRAPLQAAGLEDEFRRRAGF